MTLTKVDEPLSPNTPNYQNRSVDSSISMNIGSSFASYLPHDVKRSIGALLQNTPYCTADVDDDLIDLTESEPNECIISGRILHSTNNAPLWLEDTQQILLNRYHP